MNRHLTKGVKMENNQKRYVAYYRVSTQKQDKEMPAQKTAVKKFLKNNYPPVKSFTEVESGSNNNRPELFNALDYCVDNNCKLVVAKLDRLSRDLVFIASLQKSNVEFVCADMPEANSLTISLLACLAQWERDQIAKRTKLALAEKKKQGIKLGSHNIKVARGLKRWRKKQSQKRIKKDTELYSHKLNKKYANRVGVQVNKTSARELADQKVLPTIKSLKSRGLSFSEITKSLNKSGIKTRYGNKVWQKTQVFNIAKRNSI